MVESPEVEGFLQEGVTVPGVRLRTAAAGRLGLPSHATGRATHAECPTPAVVKERWSPGGSTVPVVKGMCGADTSGETGEKGGRKVQMTYPTNPKDYAQHTLYKYQ